MKKRRIEVTRERWTQVRVEIREPTLCPFCRGAPDLALPSVASSRAGLTLEDLNRAIRSGLLPLWEIRGSDGLVCLSCVRKLKEEKAI
jgi:hypothetical protein